MYQVTFSEQSMHELNKLDKLAQLEAIGPISILTATDLVHPREPLGRFNRAGQSLSDLLQQVETALGPTFQTWRKSVENPTPAPA